MPKNKLVCQICILVILSLFILPDFSNSVLMAGKRNKKVRLVLRVDKADYKDVERAVKSMKGNVHFKYKNASALAVSVPADKVKALLSRPTVQSANKDKTIHLPAPNKVRRPGYGVVPNFVEVRVDYVQSLSTNQMQAFGGNEPDNYSPYTNDLTRASDFSAATGLFGDGVIVGIIDSGVSSASSVAARIVGGKNFTGDGVAFDSPANGDHGTWVAHCVGGAIIVGFSTSTTADAIARYCPTCILPDFFAPGIHGIPLFGQAPSALFYALKVFPVGSTSTPSSVISAAMDEAIELKKKFDKGKPGGVNIQVVNMSLGGISTFAGDDPVNAELAEKMVKTGIVVVASAGNNGPSGMTGGDPGLAENILTVGATNDATHERIVADRFFVGPGGGFLWRPVDNHLVAEFSSRGPTADGRSDPDIVAPGKFRLMQGANGSAFTWADGTSFSAPTVAGVAALLLSADPTAKPNEIRAAILNGADADLLDGNPSFEQDQGFGFVDAMAAYDALMAGAKNPRDRGRANGSVRKNIQRLVGNRNIITGRTGSTSFDLEPGERKEFFVDIEKDVVELIVTVSGLTPELPPASQNPIFGDDLILSVVSAITSTDDVLAFAFLAGDATFSIPEEDMNFGLTRVTVMGDWTNVGKIAGTLRVEKVKGDPEYGDRLVKTRIRDRESHFFAVDVPAGALSLSSTLLWKDHWGRYPTDDLDLILEDPTGDFNFSGASFDSPERVHIAGPQDGTWLLEVSGFTVWKGKEKYELFVEVDLGAMKLAGNADLESGTTNIQLIPTDFGLTQNYPNPFNPETRINYGLPKESTVSLKIFNVRGQLVRTLVDEAKPAGFYTVHWDGTNDQGLNVPSGAYIYQIKAGDEFMKSNKMVLIK